MYNNLIAIDVETTGLDPQTCSIVSIGAVHVASGKEFYIECHPWEGAHISDGALAVNGFTREYLDSITYSEAEAVAIFQDWLEKETKTPLMLAHNSAFDKSFIAEACKRASLTSPFGFRTVDVHSIVYAHMVRTGTTPPAALTLNKCLEYFGLPVEPTPHNALTGAQCNVALWQKVI